MLNEVHFSPEIAQRICDRLSDGIVLKRICDEPGMPGYATARRWEIERPEYAELTKVAREIGCHAMADDILRVADDVTIDPQHKRHMIDARFRLLGKWLSKVYGEKLDMNHAGTVRVEKVEFVLVDPKAVSE